MTGVVADSEGIPRPLTEPDLGLSGEDAVGDECLKE